MEIKEITWQETISVRHKVLWPDKSAEFCRVPQDEEGLHFGVYIDKKLICVASVYPNHESARLRKFAAYEEFQGIGVGTALLKYILSSVKQKGVTHFWCDARESAIGFYERFGMRKEGERFYKSNVPYYKMSITFQ